MKDLKRSFSAKIFGKKPETFLKTKQTMEYIDALKSATGIKNLVIIQKGGKPKEQGTWIHKKLIIAFARWLSPDFAVWCDLQIEEILSQNQPFKSETPDLDYLKKRTELIKLSTEQLIDYKKSFYEIGIT